MVDHGIDIIEYPGELPRKIIEGEAKLRFEPSRISIINAKSDELAYDLQCPSMACYKFLENSYQVKIYFYLE